MNIGLIIISVCLVAVTKAQQGCREGNSFYPPGSQITRPCPSGQNSYTAICTSGNWQALDQTSCQSVLSTTSNQGSTIYSQYSGPGSAGCRKPGLNGVFSTYPVGSVAKMRCSDGRIFNTFCQQGGQWTDVRPQCANPNLPGDHPPQGPQGLSSQRPGFRPQQKTGQPDIMQLMSMMQLMKKDGDESGTIDPMMLAMLQGGSMSNNPLLMMELMKGGGEDSTMNPAMLMTLMNGGMGGGSMANNPMMMMQLMQALNTGSDSNSDSSSGQNLIPLMALMGGNPNMMSMLPFLSQSGSESGSPDLYTLMQLMGSNGDQSGGLMSMLPFLGGMGGSSSGSSGMDLSSLFGIMG